MNKVLQNEVTPLDAFDFLTAIAERCDEKGYIINNYNIYLNDEECEVCKLQNYILRVALIDEEILTLAFKFENTFWNTNSTCVNTYKELVELQLNIENSYIVSLN